MYIISDEQTISKHFKVKLKKAKNNMFLILKLVLIILLNVETYAYITQNIEIILLPALKPTAAEVRFTTLFIKQCLKYCSIIIKCHLIVI